MGFPLATSSTPLTHAPGRKGLRDLAAPVPLNLGGDCISPGSGMKLGGVAATIGRQNRLLTYVVRYWRSVCMSLYTSNMGLP